ncbi:MAG: single-stranded-DNA-specific exonuclease RecJ [Desulfobacteraceae bacterium]|nr:MAG: single-stranded-DNA-specific exonuclease RecJ [Desulfobacteraceae bacterium]
MIHPADFSGCLDVSEKVWVLRTALPGAPKPVREPGVSPLLSLLLANRGITEKEVIREFLQPALSYMADPMGLAGMTQAVEAVVESLEKKDRITVYGDYDADGLTATALLLRFFNDLGIAASYYLPDRVKEGYGINNSALERIAGAGGGLLITVDCGSSNGREISYARRLGLKVVVTDHHQVRGDDLPVCPVVNPSLDNTPSRYRYLAGVGVAFFLAVAVRASLRERGWFRKRCCPDLKEYLDLVALGTIADRAPILDQNRILVHKGLKVMQVSRWSGLEALKAVALPNVKDIDSERVAFRIAPRLNASGRVGDASAGLNLLMEDEPSRASEIALTLDSDNSRRQDLERQMLREAEELLSDTGALSSKRTLVAASPGWHRGVLGLVASRLAERYRRPSLVFAMEDGLAVGSGRSIEGFNLFRALESLEGITERFGGHSQAAGITIRSENLNRFAMEFETLAEHLLTDDMMIPRLWIDTELAFGEISPALFSDIDSMRPFGEGNPEPVFLARSVEMLRCQVLGERHLKMTLRQGGRVMEGIGFNLSGYRSLSGGLVDIVYFPDSPRRQGAQEVRLRIVGIREA